MRIEAAPQLRRSRSGRRRRRPSRHPSRRPQHEVAVAGQVGLAPGPRDARDDPFGLLGGGCSASGSSIGHDRGRQHRGAGRTSSPGGLPRRLTWTSPSTTSCSPTGRQLLNAYPSTAACAAETRRLLRIVDRPSTSAVGIRPHLRRQVTPARAGHAAAGAPPPRCRLPSYACRSCGGHRAQRTAGSRSPPARSRWPDRAGRQRTRPRLSGTRSGRLELPRTKSGPGPPTSSRHRPATGAPALRWRDRPDGVRHRLRRSRQRGRSPMSPSSDRRGGARWRGTAGRGVRISACSTPRTPSGSRAQRSRRSSTTNREQFGQPIGVNQRLAPVVACARRRRHAPTIRPAHRSRRRSRSRKRAVAIANAYTRCHAATFAGPPGPRRIGFHVEPPQLFSRRAKVTSSLAGALNPNKWPRPSVQRARDVLTWRQ
jgi:hypothetical protein